MNFEIALALAIVGSLNACVGAPATGAATDRRPQASSIAIAVRPPATPPSCEPVAIERPVVRQPHLGMCTE